MIYSTQIDALGAPDRVAPTFSATRARDQTVGMRRQVLSGGNREQSESDEWERCVDEKERPQLESTAGAKSHHSR